MGKKVFGTHSRTPFIFPRPANVSLQHDHVGHQGDDREDLDDIPILKRNVLLPLEFLKIDIDHDLGLPLKNPLHLHALQVSRRRNSSCQPDALGEHRLPFIS